MFASGLVAAVDFSGKQVWSKVYEKPESQYGLASSLILHEGTLILLLDQGADAEAKKSRLIGLDPATGNEKWSTPRAVGNSWASTSIIKTASRAELVTCANPLVIGYDPTTGKELWKMDGYGGEIAPSTAFDGERIIVSNDGALTMAIKPGLSGDITQSGLAWKNEEGGSPDIASPLGDGKHVLLVAGSGMLTCLNAADGKKAWEKSLETSFSASPILAGKYVYLFGQDGIARVIEMGAEYKLVAQNDLGEQIHLTPAFGDGQIIVRGPKHLICVSAGAAQPAVASPSPSPSQSQSVKSTSSTQPVAATTTSTATAATAAPAQPSQSAAYKQNWPNLRGPGNLGIAAAGDYPIAWDAAKNQNVPWKVEIPAAGKSSPVVWGDKIFLTGGDKEKYSVLCFDRATGKLLWTGPVTPSAAAKEADIFEDTGFAASTPATDGQRVYAIFASGQLAAFDFTGKQVWLKDFGLPESQYGFATSLIMHEGTLILLLDQGADAEAKKSRLIGLDPATGKEKWSTPRPVPNSWASPAIVKTASRFELVTCANPLVIGYDPANGKELWKMDGYGGEIAPSPAFDGQHIIVSNDGAATLAIKPGLSGDITQSGLAWKNEEGGCPDTASPLAFGKYVLLAANSGMITCLSAADGKKVWEHSLESQFTASPILAGKFVYLCGQDGVTRVIEPGDAWKPAGQGSVGEPIQVTPAFADGRIYIRGSKHLFCIGAKP
jgi:outer membrane protein assembly factor BamB